MLVNSIIFNKYKSCLWYMLNINELDQNNSKEYVCRYLEICELTSNIEKAWVNIKPYPQTTSVSNWQFEKYYVH